jgi:DNA polymerase
MSPTLHLDFETASTVDLKRAGVSRYARHASTTVLCVAWAFDDEPVRWHCWQKFDRQLPQAIRDHILGGGTVHAWNTAFEMSILEHLFGIPVDPGQFVCTMQRSLHAGYPGALADAGPAMGLRTTKDADGHRLMMKMCKPRDKALAAADGYANPAAWWHLDPVLGLDMLERLALYCVRDVAAERATGRVIPRLLPDEKLVSEMDWHANRRGVRLDIDLVERFIRLAEMETKRLDNECEIVTLGAVTSPGTQTERLRQWLAGNGCPLDDVGRETIAETLETAADAELPDAVSKVLSIRQRVAKSSVKKLKSMLASVDADERVRFVLQYYGAGRTGRWSGRLIQPQNFPRPAKAIPIDRVVDFVKHAFAKNSTEDALDLIRTVWGEPLEVIARCLRGTIVPAAGKVLVVFDFAQIEARVLAWLAGQQDILDEFASGRDVYAYTRDKLGLPTRDAGKVVVLGLGYGTGWKKFVELAKGYGLTVSPLESQHIVQSWRNANMHITGFWRELDVAAHTAITYRVTVSCRRGIKVLAKTGGNGVPLMTIQLPSGRHLFYRNPRLVSSPQAGRDEIVFDGVDQTTKKWTPIRTWGAKLAENVTQAVARDVMTEAARRIERRGFATELILSVHDELIWEAGPDIYVTSMKTAIETLPAWAWGLPVACEGGVMLRYGKK